MSEHTNEMTIDIATLPEETLRVIIALAADRDTSPNAIALEMLNYAAAATLHTTAAA
jgi:hypothetical protein